MKASVVIPTYNGACTLPYVLECISSFDPTDIAEVVVVDDGSDQDISELIFAHTYPFEIRCFRLERKGERRGHARNIGINNSSGDVVLFLDDDCLPTNGLLASHLARHRRHHDNLVVVGARHRVRGVQAAREAATCDRHESVNDPRFINGTGNHKIRPPWYSAYSCHISVSRQIALLGFDESFVGWGLEDQEFALRAYMTGAVFEFQMKPQVIHIEPNKMRDPYRADKLGQRGDYGSFVLNAGRFYAKHHRNREAVELLLKGMNNLNLVSGQWNRVRHGMDATEVLLWALNKLGEDSVATKLVRSLGPRLR